ncbi:MAG: YbjQ family protein [Blastocatellia bacterium]|nr:YbjQ family protein [Blastocatellia bacterium]
MIVTTGFEIEGNGIVEYLGVVRGLVVRATGLGRGIVGGIKSLAGGNIEEWSAICEEARREAFGRLVQHGREIGADAIIGMRYDATEFSQGAAEVLPYGTAVRLAKSATPD